ncbi:aminotransferase [Thelonectria olida]|uniref:Branched-chain-amino-acid aminotransferase n=1 Tax=Thelonectria olida TaxID=1576542 RepID=A0A9P8VVG6_9HYPO|nr:aminotransferase [Thelonectria olida]
MVPSKLVLNLVPYDQQSPVPGLYDPIRMTNKAVAGHLLQMPWDEETGWGSPTIGKYDNLSLDPSASVLHYATETFEGMKAYRGFDGKLRLFRPELNAERLLRSNARVSLPSFDPKAALELIAAYAAVECPRWLPEPGSHLYIRPAMIGSGRAIGINKPPEALFFVFGTLFPQARRLATVYHLLTSQPSQIRAWPGGFGANKVGANYGPSITSHVEAKRRGCNQTLWLFGQEELVTEAGGSNFFVVMRRQNSDQLELVTSPLDTGIILDGITRRSVLDLARERAPDLEVVERPLTMSEIAAAASEGRLVESFVSGTAVFISPVASITHGDSVVRFPMTVLENGEKRPAEKYSTTIRTWLEEIIYGKVDHPWGYIVEENQQLGSS